MGAAGSPYATFRRALWARNVTLALAEARELPRLGLADSLELLLLIAAKRPDLYERAAVRWVREQTRAGSLPHVPLGRYRRYDRAELEAWVDSLRAGGGTFRKHQPRSF